MTDHHPSARDELGDAFIADFFADWQQHGPDVIGRLRDEKPADYVRIAAAILPKERNPRPDPIDELTDAELFERIASVATRTGLEVRAAVPHAGDEAARNARPSRA